MSPRPLRIVVDAQGLQSGSRDRGIGRYATNLVRAMARLADEVEMVLVVSGALPGEALAVRDDLSGALDPARIVVSPLEGDLRAIDVGNAARRRVAERIQAAYLGAWRPDAVVTLSPFETAHENVVPALPLAGRHGVPHVSVLYDLIPSLAPNTFLPEPVMRRYFAGQLDRLLASDLVLTISSSSRSDLLALSNFAPERAVVIGGGFDHLLQPQVEALEGDARLRDDVTDLIMGERDLVLCVGGGDPHKRLEHLIEAFSRSDAATSGSATLVLVGPLAGFRRTLEAAAVLHGLRRQQIAVLDRIPDADLSALYRAASLVVCPSIVEGLGFAPFEAAMHGCPVIVAANGVVRELIPDESLWFDPYSVEALTSKIDSALAHPGFRASGSSALRDVAERSTWDAVARRAVDAIASICRESVVGNHPEGDALQISPGPSPESLVKEIVPYVDATVDRAWVARAIATIAAAGRAVELTTVFVDVTELHARDAGTGIQRVTRNLLRALPEIVDASTVRIVPVVSRRDSGRFEYYELDGGSGDMPLARRDIGDPVRPLPGDVLLCLDLRLDTEPSEIERLRMLGVRTWFIVYDLIPVNHPEFWPKGSEIRETFARWLGTVGTADGAVCISSAVADDLRTWLAQHWEDGAPRARPFHAGWAHLSGDLEHRPRAAAGPDRGDESDHSAGSAGAPLLATGTSSTAVTFLVVGTFEPRKGQRQVLDAFRRLWREGSDVRLVLAGRPGWLMEEFLEEVRSEAHRNPRFELFEGPDDGVLKRLYAESDCIIAGSVAEGFGLPLVEAFAERRPVLARNLPVFREIGGPDTTYFDGDDAESLAAAVTGWVHRHRAGEIRIPEPWERSWAEVAADVMRIVLAPERDAARFVTDHAGVGIVVPPQGGASGR